MKTFSSRGINELRGARGTPVWQRGYYERVVRSEEQLNRIREYISANPVRWVEERYHMEDLILVREGGTEVVRQAEKRMLIGHCAHVLFIALLSWQTTGGRIRPT